MSGLLVSFSASAGSRRYGEAEVDSIVSDRSHEAARVFELPGPLKRRPSFRKSRLIRPQSGSSGPKVRDPSAQPIGLGFQQTCLPAPHRGAISSDLSTTLPGPLNSWLSRPFGTSEGSRA